MDSLIPGFITPEDAAARGLVTHNQAWVLVVPECPLIPTPTLLFWQIAAKHPMVFHDEKNQDYLIPQEEAPNIFPDWVIRETVEACVKFKLGEISNNTIHKADLLARANRVATRINADKECVRQMKERLQVLYDKEFPPIAKEKNV
jgi:hypothetical protein